MVLAQVGGSLIVKFAVLPDSSGVAFSKTTLSSRLADPTNRLAGASIKAINSAALSPPPPPPGLKTIVDDSLSTVAIFVIALSVIGGLCIGAVIATGIYKRRHQASATPPNADFSKPPPIPTKHDLSDYRRMMKNRSSRTLMSQQSEAHQKFEEYDFDHNGQLDRKEMEQYVSSLGFELPPTYLVCTEPVF
jgi:H+/gluconate symporter-like permease